MAGHHPFKKLRDKMSPERLARSHALAQEMMAEMLLAEIRKHERAYAGGGGAARLGIKQPSLSEAGESGGHADQHVAAAGGGGMGGRLEIIAHLPRGYSDWAIQGSVVRLKWR